ncbi:WG repeat-containing protein [Aerosakkonema sp. BLCC-F183]|uniref:WG repeat-containing protein n=1 Tax=Aerosakkonema sp. BLCC-F183 TaxID=3342834 RepID=UPI0035BABEED
MLVGKTLRNRYKIIKQLGSGGFGDTYLATDMDLPGNPQCVVKHLTPKTPDPAVLPVARRLFETEAQVLYNLGNHDQIPQLFAHFEENGEFYLVQEFIDGDDLSKELTSGKCLREAEVIKLLRDILEILEFVHQHNVIHRDIKPENLMRRRKDKKIVIIDFGAVKEIRSLAVNTQGQVLPTIVIGTPGYMPTEQNKGFPNVYSDIYAVGMLGIQALSGVVPHQLQKDPSTQEIIWRNKAKVSSRFGNVLDKMVRYNAAQRYQSVSQVLEDIMFFKSLIRSVVIGLGGLVIGVVATVVFVTRLQSPYRQPAVSSNPSPIATSSASTPTPLSSLPQSSKPENINFAIQPKFDWVSNFSDGLARVKIDGKYGYIDKYGDVVIKPQFDEADDFYEGLAVVWISGQNSGYIDKTGNFVIQPQFAKNAAKKFSEGLARVWVVNTYGYIDQTGRFVIERKFPAASDFSEGLAAVRSGDKVGYIDSSGYFIISPQFDYGDDFSEGLAWVEIGGKRGYIDRSGKFVIQPQFDKAYTFSEGLAPVKIGNKWGYIDKSGNMVIQPKFDDGGLGKFSEGMSAVKIDNKWGFIDKSGNLVIQPQFGYFGKFTEGIALVKIGNKWGYIDKSGNMVIQPQFDEAYGFSEGMAIVKTQGKYGYIRNPLN